MQQTHADPGKAIVPANQQNNSLQKWEDVQIEQLDRAVDRFQSDIQKWTSGSNLPATVDGDDDFDWV